jgi:hypothetical protein
MSHAPVPNFIVVIDHAGAKVFCTMPAPAGASAQEIARDASQHFRHQIDRKDHNADREESYPQDTAFFEQIALACKSGDRIVLTGHGKGQSNEAHDFSAFLATHHPDLAARVLPILNVDLSHITDNAFIGSAHHALHMAAVG